MSSPPPYEDPTPPPFTAGGVNDTDDAMEVVQDVALTSDVADDVADSPPPTTATSTTASSSASRPATKWEQLQVETFENERWFLFRWRPPALPTDRPHWSSRDGSRQVLREQLGLPQHGWWRWQEPWRHEPWVYALDWWFEFHPSNSTLDAVRRRRWFRTAHGFTYQSLFSMEITQFLHVLQSFAEQQDKWPSFADKLKSNGIRRVSDLVLLRAEDWKELDIPLGHFRRLQAAATEIARFSRMASSAPPHPDAPSAPRKRNPQGSSSSSTPSSAPPPPSGPPPPSAKQYRAANTSGGILRQVTATFAPTKVSRKGLLFINSENGLKPCKLVDGVLHINCSAEVTADAFRNDRSTDVVAALSVPVASITALSRVGDKGIRLEFTEESKETDAMAPSSSSSSGSSSQVTLYASSEQDREAWVADIAATSNTLRFVQQSSRSLSQAAHSISSGLSSVGSAIVNSPLTRVFATAFAASAGFSAGSRAGRDAYDAVTGRRRSTR